MSAHPTFYEILAIPSNADEKQIKAAIKKLRAFHDLTLDLHQFINEIEENLVNAERRVAYNQSIGLSAPALVDEKSYNTESTSQPHWVKESFFYKKLGTNQHYFTKDGNPIFQKDETVPDNRAFNECYFGGTF